MVLQQLIPVLRRQLQRYRYGYKQVASLNKKKVGKLAITLSLTRIIFHHPDSLSAIVLTSNMLPVPQLRLTEMKTVCKSFNWPNAVVNPLWTLLKHWDPSQRIDEWKKIHSKIICFLQPYNCQHQITQSRERMLTCIKHMIRRSNLPNRTSFTTSPSRFIFKSILVLLAHRH